MIYLLLAVIALAVFLYIEDKWITVTEYTYESEKIPEAFDGYIILHVSDLQSAYFGREQKNLLKKSQETKPDAIFFTGDLVDRNRTDLKASLIAAEGLQKTAPVYFVSGNHETRIEDRLDEFYSEMEGSNIILLRNDVYRLQHRGQHINIAGIWDDVLCECKLGERRRDTSIDPAPLQKVMSELTEKLSENEFNILLTHEPQFFDHYVNDKIDLAFAGHAHGGQIRLPFTDGLFAPGQGIMPKLTSGMRKKGKTTMVISRGLGNSVFPFRVFNRPELVVVKLKKKS